MRVEAKNMCVSRYTGVVVQVEEVDEDDHGGDTYKKVYVVAGSTMLGFEILSHVNLKAGQPVEVSLGRDREPVWSVAW